MCRGWKKGEWQAVPNNIARKFHSSQLCWIRQENEWSIGCCKSFHIPHLFHICHQLNCYIIWNVQNKYATYTYKYKCGRTFTATLFQLMMMNFQSLEESYYYTSFLSIIWYLYGSPGLPMISVGILLGNCTHYHI